jgi:hypothetical protein
MAGNLRVDVGLMRRAKTCYSNVYIDPRYYLTLSPTSLPVLQSNLIFDLAASRAEEYWILLTVVSRPRSGDEVMHLDNADDRVYR